MSGLSKASHFSHFEFNVSINHAVSEHTTLSQECTVFVQILQSLIQAVANGWDQCIFLGWEVVQVFGCGLTGVNLVLDAIKSSHQQCSKAQVGVGHGIRETRLDASAFVAGNERNADRS